MSVPAKEGALDSSISFKIQRLKELEQILLSREQEIESQRRVKSALLLKIHKMTMNLEKTKARIKDIESEAGRNPVDVFKRESISLQQQMHEMQAEIERIQQQLFFSRQR